MNKFTEQANLMKEEITSYEGQFTVIQRSDKNYQKLRSMLWIN